MLILLLVGIMAIAGGALCVVVMGRAIQRREAIPEERSFGEMVEIRETLWREYGV